MFNGRAIGLSAVALKVAVQPALAFGSGQRITGQCEVVHADVGIAVADEADHGASQHLHPVVGRQQLLDHDAPLRLEALRQVGVGNQRDAVGPQLGDLGDGAGEGPVLRFTNELTNEIDGFVRQARRKPQP